MERRPVSLTFKLIPSGTVEEAETIIQELVESTIQNVMSEHQTWSIKRKDKPPRNPT